MEEEIHTLASLTPPEMEKHTHVICTKKRLEEFLSALGQEDVSLVQEL